MKKLLLGLIVLLLIFIFPYLNSRANSKTEEPNFSYYQTRYQIACRDHDEADARCFWNKVEFVHAKEALGRNDVRDYLTSGELERISKRLGFLRTRYQTFCKGVDEPAYFCPALDKLVEKGQYFLKNDQVYLSTGSATVRTEATVID